MTPLAMVYLLYLLLSGLITVRVGSTLFHHGRPFLVDVFCGNERTAEAVNHLLLVGFYLTNIAFVLFQMQSGNTVDRWLAGAHLLAEKVGVVLVTLGVMHFFNVFVLLRVKGYVRRLRLATGRDN